MFCRRLAASHLLFRVGGVVSARRLAAVSSETTAKSFQHQQYRRIMSSSSLSFQPTCDLYDQYLDRARVPTVDWKHYGKRTSFCGRAVTIKCFEDNSRLKEQCEAAGDDRVLVVDAGGSRRCAVMGDMLAANAAKNDWAGIIVFGCVRDTAVLCAIDVGITALGSTPRKSTRRGEGQLNIPVRIGDVECRPGDYVFADDDGVLILDPTDVDRDGR